MKVKDVNLSFRQKLIDFFDIQEKLSEGTIERCVKEVKKISNYTQKNDIELSYKLIFFNGFATKSFKIILSFDEIEKISKMKFEDKHLSNARDWLILSCYIGQRVSH